ncbi:MAG UNVERIFIED_CONTAM: hypothetical protein LVT10_21180 [Anaerolineae bacterium]
MERAEHLSRRGNQAPDPAAYTAMLCQAYDLLKQIDPSSVVMSGPLAPTNALGGLNLERLRFLATDV